MTLSEKQRNEIQEWAWYHDWKQIETDEYKKAIVQLTVQERLRIIRARCPLYLVNLGLDVIRNYRVHFSSEVEDGDLIVAEVSKVLSWKKKRKVKLAYLDLLNKIALRNLGSHHLRVVVSPGTFDQAIHHLHRRYKVRATKLIRKMVPDFTEYDLEVIITEKGS